MISSTPSLFSAVSAALSCPRPPSMRIRSGSGFVLLEQPPVSPVDRLGHRAEVVRADRRVLMLKIAVLLLVELPAVEDDHPGDGVACPGCSRCRTTRSAGSRRSMPRTCAEARGRDLQAVLLRFAEPRLVREPRVAVRELHPVDALAALRHAHAHLARCACVREPLARAAPRPRSSNGIRISGGMNRLSW